MNWKTEFGAFYESDLEDTHRKRIFKENLDFITAHNSDPTATYTMGLTKFANLTYDEFLTEIKCLGKHEGGPDPECPTAPNPLDMDENDEDYIPCPTYPTSNATVIDWTAKGAVTAVKD